MKSIFDLYFDTKAKLNDLLWTYKIEYSSVFNNI